MGHVRSALPARLAVAVQRRLGHDLVFRGATSWRTHPLGHLASRLGHAAVLVAEFYLDFVLRVPNKTF